jgi:hypothetical protein
MIHEKEKDHIVMIHQKAVPIVSYQTNWLVGQCDDVDTTTVASYRKAISCVVKTLHDFRGE